MNTKTANGQDNYLTRFARFLATGALRVMTGQTPGHQAIEECEASAVEATSNDTTSATIQQRVGAGDVPAEEAENVGANCEQKARLNGGEDSPQRPTQQPSSENTELQGRLDL